MIDTNKGPMTVGAIIDDLTYSNYRHNRNIAPHVTPLEWARIYPGADALEARYQAETAEARYQAETAIANAARSSNDHSNAVGGDARASGGTNQEGK